MTSIRFNFKHPNGEEKPVTLTMKMILNLIEDDLLETVCNCDCQTVGETNVLDCGCWEYYSEFILDDYQIIGD